MAASSDRRAFTLTELAVVVLIISIMTAVAVPAFLDSLLFYRIESAARRVKADLEFTRQSARLTSAAQTITFTSATYTTTAGVDGPDQSAGTYTVDLSAGPYEISSVAADFEGDDSVTFDGYGTPSAGGAVVLNAPRHQCTVTLDEATGEVSITRSHTAGTSPE